MFGKLTCFSLAAALAASVIALGAPRANAAIMSADAADFTPVQTVSPGVYGLEARGGRPGARDWEIGVGTQTSNAGSFSQGGFTWNATLGAPFAFSLTWDSGELSVTIGGTTVSYNADWVFGNALLITTKGSDTGSATGGASLFIDTIDGVSVGQTYGGSGSFFNQDVLTGIEFLDGFSITGTIDLVNDGGSRNEVLITVGNVAGSTPVPEPGTLGLLGVGLLGFSLARRRTAK